MISLNQAKKIALNKITYKGAKLRENPPMLIEESIEEYEWGWLFYYDSKAFIETKDENLSYTGNAPVLVDKVDGEAIYIGLSLEGVESKVQAFFSNKGYGSRT